MKCGRKKCKKPIKPGQPRQVFEVGEPDPDKGESNKVTVCNTCSQAWAKLSAEKARELLVTFLG